MAPDPFDAWLRTLSAHFPVGLTTQASAQLVHTLYQSDYAPEDAADEILLLNLFGGTAHVH